MIEDITIPESGAEKIPSMQDVLDGFDRIINGAEVSEVRI